MSVYVVEEHAEVGKAGAAPLRAWRSVPSPFGGELRAPHLERACEFAFDHTLRTGRSTRVVRGDGRAIVLYTADTIQALTQA